MRGDVAQKKKPSAVAREGFFFVSGPKLEPGPKTVKGQSRRNRRRLRIGATGRRKKTPYFFLVVFFVVDFFADFLAAAFFAMALYLLSVKRM